MSLLPLDDQGRYRGLPTGETGEWVAHESPRLLAENELEDLVALANSGDADATQKLREFFGERHGGGTFKRVLFQALARGGLGAYASWDQWCSQADFERIEEGLRPEGGTFAENLLAEAAAFAHATSYVAGKRAFDVDFNTRDRATVDTERVVRNRWLNAQSASLSFVRVFRCAQSELSRRAQKENVEARTEETRARTLLHQERLRQMRAEAKGHDTSVRPEVGRDVPDTGHGLRNDDPSAEPGARSPKPEKGASKNPKPRWYLSEFTEEELRFVRPCPIWIAEQKAKKSNPAPSNADVPPLRTSTVPVDPDVEGRLGSGPSDMSDLAGTDHEPRTPDHDPITETDHPECGTRDVFYTSEKPVKHHSCEPGNPATTARPEAGRDVPDEGGHPIPIPDTRNPIPDPRLLPMREVTQIIRDLSEPKPNGRQPRRRR